MFFKGKKRGGEVRWVNENDVLKVLLPIYGVRYLKNGRVTKNRNFKNERVEVRGRLPLEGPI